MKSRKLMCLGPEGPDCLGLEDISEDVLPTSDRSHLRMPEAGITGLRGAHWVQSCRTPGAVFPCCLLSLCTSLSHLSHVGLLTVKRQLPESKGPREGLWAVLFQPLGPLPIGHCCQWTVEEELSLGAQIWVTCPPQSQRWG